MLIMPRCPKSIFNPINTRISPPANSALALYFSPNTLPTLRPVPDKIKVIVPIKSTAVRILTSGRSAKVIPAARASMLVATAMMNMVFGAKESSAELSGSFPKDSRIMFPPMKPSSRKAIQ